MSTTDALEELATLAGQSSMSAAFDAARRRVVNSSVINLEMRPLHRRASDLLGAVLALSARTRRVVQPRVEIDLDVYTPFGKRAVSLQLKGDDA